MTKSLINLFYFILFYLLFFLHDVTLSFIIRKQLLLSS